MEQSIDTLRDIRTIVSEIRSGGANIFVMLDDGADSQRALDEIRSAIDGLSSLPADLEPTTIIQMREDDEDIEVGFYGFQSREALHAFSELARERLLNLPAVGQVQGHASRRFHNRNVSEFVGITPIKACSQTILPR